MKLKNKKTGEIDNWCIDKDVIRTCSGSIVYNSLAKLNEEWKVYKEPSGYWYIDFDGDVLGCVEDFDEETDEKRKQIGNYFETKEEAEKAAERLRAWKRLKDKGFRFIPEASYIEEQPKETEGSMMFIACTMNDYRDFVFGDNADIKLLFSQEVKNE